MEDEDLKIVVTRKLKSIGNRWNELEKRIKETEKAKLEVEVASINELRYAGRKIVDAFFYLQSENKEENGKGLDCIIVAEQYCENADHDLTDSLCSYCDKKIRTMIEVYGLSTMVKYFPNTPDILKCIDYANEVIPNSREDRNSRHAEYKILKDEIVPKLTSYHKTILYAQEMIEIDLIKQEKKEERANKIAIIGIATGVVGLIIAIVAIIVSIKIAG